MPTQEGKSVLAQKESSFRPVNKVLSIDYCSTLYCVTLFIIWIALRKLCHFIYYLSSSQKIIMVKPVCLLSPATYQSELRCVIVSVSEGGWNYSCFLYCTIFHIPSVMMMCFEELNVSSLCSPPAAPTTTTLQTTAQPDTTTPHTTSTIATTTTPQNNFYGMVMTYVEAKPNGDGTTTVCTVQ